MRKIGLLLAFLLLLAISPVGGAVAAGLITGRDIVNGSIKAADLGKGSVNRKKIANSAVSSDKIANGTIGAADIADGAITAAKIKPGLDADTVDGKHASEFAVSNHSHDSSYAAASHAHDSLYALVSHDHADTYSPFGHDHDSDYSPVGHGHDASYAAIVHAHDGNYSPLGHSHDTSYAANNHDHDSRYYTEAESDGKYALAGHSHDATKTGVLLIPASSFREHGAYTFDLEDGYAYGTGVGFTYVDAPVVLPDGAVIKELSFDVFDEIVNYDALIDFFRWSPSSELERLARIESSGAPTGWQKLTTTTFSDPVVDNDIYSNSIEVRLHGPSLAKIRIGTGRITYEYRSDL